MTETAITPEQAARTAALEAGLSVQGLVPIHQQATLVYHLPAERLVARVTPAGESESMKRSIALARWLAAQDFWIVEAADVPQLISHGPHVVTFWKHYQQEGGHPPPYAYFLGLLLRRLHSLPEPPVALPAHRPLTAVKDAVAVSTTLTDDDRRWMEHRVQGLTAAYDALDFPLGTGLIHGRAFPGNTIWDDRRHVWPLIGEWETAAIGPREIDLVSTFHGAVRYGRRPRCIRAFIRAYGYDPQPWRGMPLLLQIRDLESLAPWIRRADAGDQDARRTLLYRLSTLQLGDTEAEW
ncbi:phosphotransferase family protein [Streptomyces mobaraensis]|uniref:Aminoglycoside phosphotransferase family protein n=1 Tax=Streptomyces mobaraensis TaxID=35621 RepID=A0A5N5W1P0_STRMB|nr:aminoglycoside phosphotransferase family protein [Streptomyces mobaraensis]KAB7835789.1 aminoglycoside phosphotransferase family protein [Streptomyces mobaraensis]